jgi:hypothetical protein
MLPLSFHLSFKKSGHETMPFFLVLVESLHTYETRCNADDSGWIPEASPGNLHPPTELSEVSRVPR